MTAAFDAPSFNLTMYFPEVLPGNLSTSRRGALVGLAKMGAARAIAAKTAVKKRMVKTVRRARRPNWVEHLRKCEE